MADRMTIMAGVWDCLVEEWNAGNVERARSLERFYTALEQRTDREAAEPHERSAAHQDADR